METPKYNDFLSISEYARLKNVSVAAVYKRLDGTLKPYLKIIDGKKYLSSEALEADKGIKQVFNGIQQPFNTPVESRQEEAATREKPGENEAIIKALEALEKQLSEKDNQIARLQEEAKELRQAAAEKDKFIQEQSKQLSLLLEQSQELQRNNQILLGAAQGMKPGESLEAQEATRTAENNESINEAPGAKETDRGSRGGFWKRLFGVK